MPDPDPRLQALAAKVDAFFTRVSERYPGDLQCGSGCADCCHAELTVTAVEAGAVRAAVATLGPAARAALVARAAAAPDPARPRCVALGDDDRCQIYAGRPLVCRSHGVPVRISTGADARTSRAELVVCPRNFTGRELDRVDADCVLDQTTLSATLLAVDQAASPDAAGARIALRAVIAACR